MNRLIKIALLSSFSALVAVSCSVMPLQKAPVSGTGSAVQQPSGGGYDPGAGWQLTWSDEFDGNAVDTTKWSFDEGGTGWGNSELEYYRRENATVAQGCLNIAVKRESYNGMPFTSARMKTQGKFQAWYGKIAARIKVPYGKGMWPAFWMLGRDFDGNNWPAIGEIDIMEMAGGQGGDVGDATTYSTMHWDENGQYAMYGTRYTSPARLADDYHIFEVEWTPDSLTGKIDGIPYYSNNFFYQGNNGKGHNEFQFPFFIILNCAVGGRFFNPPLLNAADVTAPFPQTMQVDWVRYYTNQTLSPRMWAPDSRNKLVIFSETNIGNACFSVANQTLDAWAGTCTIRADSGAASEGAASWKVNVGSIGWMGFGASAACYGADLRGYRNTSLKFDIKTSSAQACKVGIKTGPILEAWVRLDGSLGYRADGAWHTVTVPMSKFFEAQPWLDFKFVSQFFMFASDGPSISGDGFYFDNIYWTAGNEPSPPDTTPNPPPDTTPNPPPDTTPNPPPDTSGPGADYTQSAAALSSSIATVNFRPLGFAPAYVIVHYRTAGRPQQNVTMTRSGAAGDWETTVQGLAPGSIISYNFTCEKNGVQFDTPWFTYAMNGSPPPIDTASPGPSGIIVIPGVVAANVGALADGATIGWTVRCAAANYRVLITLAGTQPGRLFTVTFDNRSVTLSGNGGQTVIVDFANVPAGVKNLVVQANSTGFVINRVEAVVF